QIHLFDDFSTVELPANLPEDLLGTLKRTRVRQMPLNIRALSAAEAAATPERRRPPRDDAYRGSAADDRPRRTFDADRKPPPEGSYPARGGSRDGGESAPRRPAQQNADGPRRPFDKPARPYDGPRKPYKRRDG
ncbi:MAG TPA: ATP-dependent RNA helicase, partial [Thauera sp.]|nr:ATP-dependent RNA helicase [Thauera sp.]